jgi:hypothetical protein
MDSWNLNFPVVKLSGAAVAPKRETIRIGGPSKHVFKNADILEWGCAENGDKEEFGG